MCTISLFADSNCIIAFSLLGCPVDIIPNSIPRILPFNDSSMYFLIMVLLEGLVVFVGNKPYIGSEPDGIVVGKRYPLKLVCSIVSPNNFTAFDIPQLAASPSKPLAYPAEWLGWAVLEPAFNTARPLFAEWTGSPASPSHKTLIINEGV